MKPAKTYRKKAPRKSLTQIIAVKGDGNATQKITELLNIGVRAKNAKREAERGHRDRTNLWASDLGKCGLKVYRSLRNETETNPPDERSQIKFLRGHIAERALAELFIAAGCELIEQERAEIPLGPTTMTVKPDFLLFVPANVAKELGFGDAACLLEIKSTPARAVGSMLRNGQRGRLEHRLQAASYLLAARMGLFTLPHSVDRFYLVYVLEDPTAEEPPLVAFELPWSRYEGKVGDAIEKALDVWKAAQEGTAPPKPAGAAPDAYPCGGDKGRVYCPFFDACWPRQESA